MTEKQVKNTIFNYKLEILDCEIKEEYINISELELRHLDMRKRRLQKEVEKLEVKLNEFRLKKLQQWI